MIKKLVYISSISLIFPSIALADVENLQDLVNELVSFINSLVPLLLGIAMVAFMWGVIKYIWSANPQKLTEARKYMVFSIIGFTVMLSVWGLALLLKNTFFPSASTPFKQNPYSQGVDYYGPQNPQFPGPNTPYDPNNPIAPVT